MFGQKRFSQKLISVLLIIWITFAFAAPVEYRNHWIVFAGLTLFIYIISILIIKYFLKTNYFSMRMILYTNLIIKYGFKSRLTDKICFIVFLYYFINDKLNLIAIVDF